MMKALVFHGIKDLRWQDWQETPPARGEVTVQIRAVGICGSDLHGYTGESGRRVPPMIMGHEATGEVVECGADVPTRWLGQRVIIQPFVACGVCDFCQMKQPNLCRNRRFYGGNINGAMAEYLTLPITQVLPLPENLSYEHGTLTEPLAVALHAVHKAGDFAGKAVLIAGAGPIGLLVLAAARLLGAKQIVITDIQPERLQTAQMLGADATLNPTLSDWHSDMKEQLGVSEVDIAFDAVGIAATLRQCVENVYPGGLVIGLGGWRTVDLNLAPVVAREVRLHGSFNFTPDEFTTASQQLAQGLFNPAHLVTAVRPLPDGAAVFAELLEQQTQIKTVLVQKVSAA